MILAKNAIQMQLINLWPSILTKQSERVNVVETLTDIASALDKIISDEESESESKANNINEPEDLPLDEISDDEWSDETDYED